MNNEQNNLSGIYPMFEEIKTKLDKLNTKTDNTPEMDFSELTAGAEKLQEAIEAARQPVRHSHVIDFAHNRAIII